MHVNYRYLVDAANKVSSTKGDLLDVGCGKGDIVQLATQNGWQSQGIEFFGEGSGTNIKSVLIERGLLGASVQEYDGVTFPFPDESFDIVLSNQVFEHVPDLDAILSEVSRVLKPGGALICTFPYQDAIREGHSNVLFAHWFPKSRVRVVWLFLFRCLGIGRLKRKRTRWEWAHFFNDFLAEQTFYLKGKDIRQKFQKNFKDVSHQEHEYLAFRFYDIGRVSLAQLSTNAYFQSISKWVTRMFGSLVIVARK